MKKKNYTHLYRVLSCTLLLFTIHFQAEAQTGCPAVVAAGATTVCPGNCTTLSATVQATLGTTNYTVAAIPYAPFSYTAGTAVIVGMDDIFSGVISLPFNFCYFGTSYNQCVIGANGDLTFDLTQAGAYDPWSQSSGPAPNSAYPTNIMSPFHDIDPALGGTITWALYGTAPCRQLVISYNQVPMFSCTTEIATQQIVLNETTNYIDVFIENKPLCATWNNGAAILGIQNTTYTTAITVPGRNGTQWSATNEGWRFSPSGAPSYTLTWFNGATNLGSTPTVSVCPTATTTYTAQLVNTNCDGTNITLNSMVTVTVGGAPVTVVPANPSICPGGSVNLTASGATTYSWSPATGLNTTTGSTVTASPTVNTTYTVTGTSTGCNGVATVTVTLGGGPALTPTQTNVLCNGGSTGAASVTATGGPYTYSWNPGGATTSGITGIPAGNYTVTVSTATGCTSTQVFNITEPPALTLSVAGIAAACNGVCNGQLICIPSGGTSPYNFTWSTGCSTPSCNNICAGAYSLTVHDANGCAATGTATVTQPAPLTVNLFPFPSHCGAADGKDSAVVSGGTVNYTYSWTPGGNTAAVDNNLAPGNYTLTVTDSKGCNVQGTSTINNSSGVTASISASTNVTCYNGSNGSATALAGGGTAPYNYSWSPITCSTATASNLPTGSYTCHITDAIGCTAQTIVVITQPSQVVVTPVVPAVICITQSAPLTATAVGGGGIYTYSWTLSGTGVTSPVSPVVTTTYTVICTDQNGCVSAPATVVVTVNPPLSLSAMPNVSVCPGVNSTLSALASGGNGNYAYAWTPAAGLSSTNISNPVATPAATTVYTVTVSDNCGTPPVTGTVTVTVYAPPVISFTANDTTGCAPLCVKFTAVSNPACQSAAWQYGDGLTGTGCGTVNHCYPNAGTFDVTLKVTDINSCVSTVTKPGYINVYPVPHAAFTANPARVTILSPIVYFTDASTGANTWNWNFGDFSGGSSTLQNPMYTYPDTGCFNVHLLVLNSFGCRDSAVSPVCVAPDFTFYAPNSFTPNGDGLNDVFVPKGYGVRNESYTLDIFDRWGNQLFHSETWDKGWDGKANFGANIAQVDTYVWRVSCRDYNNIKHVFTGMVNLLK
ncbi:MAG: PKD domain-containing protein [Bacteroidia bacterium]